MNRKEVSHIVSTCLIDLYKNHQVLVDRNVREEAITSRLVDSLRTHFEDGQISVDPEYDKHLDGQKEYETEEGQIKRLRPDIVIHQIGNDDQNLIAFECKKEKIKKGDEDKIDALLRQYNYRFGVLVEYNHRRFYIWELVNDHIESELHEI